MQNDTWYVIYQDNQVPRAFADKSTAVFMLALLSGLRMMNPNQGRLEFSAGADWQSLMFNRSC